MGSRCSMNRLALVAACGLLGVAYAVAQAEDAPDTKGPATTEASASNEAEDPQIVAARKRAELMHQMYASTLEVMHDRYFHGDRDMVPARALEDVFEAMERQTKTKARWISVNTKPMSIQHAPKSDFEKQAAEKIGAGEEFIEQVKDGVYERAGAISLHGGCVSCHTGFFSGAPKSPRFAGLVLSIPLEKP